MIIPSKVTPYKKSIISRVPLLLDSLKYSDKTPAKLWEEIQNHFEDISEFILAIDIAFVLGSLEYEKEKQVIAYVKTDTM